MRRPLVVAAALLLFAVLSTPLIAGPAPRYDGNSAVGVAGGTFTNSTSTFANVGGLSAPLAAGGTYICDGTIATTSSAGGGVKVTLAGDGVLTATAFMMQANFFTGAAGAGVQTTVTLGNALGRTQAVAGVTFHARIVVGVGGTILFQAAQNAADATATTVTNGSAMACYRVS